MEFIRRAIRVSAVCRAEDGQTMAEYALVLTVITIGVVVTIGLLSGAIQGPISTVIGYL